MSHLQTAPYYIQLVSKKHAASYWKITPAEESDIVNMAAG
jgi:hypothetical protein